MVLLAAMSLHVTADNFTPAEQQQISIATPGLFAKSKSFTLDLSVLPQGDWSFPLPVGESRKGPGEDIMITTTTGDAVKAMFSGRVRLSRNVPGHGVTVVVRHGNGLETVYARLRGATVKPGQRVKAGQTVGIVGEEAGKGVCRFGIMVNGFPVNVETLVDIVRKRLRRQSYLFTDRGISVEIAALGNASDGPDIAEGMPEPGGLANDEAVDVDTEFTSYEKRVVSAPTKGLFDDASSITINLHQYGDGDWAYPCLVPRSSVPTAENVAMPASTLKQSRTTRFLPLSPDVFASRAIITAMAVWWSCVTPTGWRLCTATIPKTLSRLAIG